MSRRVHFIWNLRLYDGRSIMQFESTNAGNVLRVWYGPVTEEEREANMGKGFEYSFLNGWASGPFARGIIWDTLRQYTWDPSTLKLVDKQLYRKDLDFDAVVFQSGLWKSEPEQEFMGK